MYKNVPLPNFFCFCTTSDENAVFVKRQCPKCSQTDFYHFHSGKNSEPEFCKNCGKTDDTTIWCICKKFWKDGHDQGYEYVSLFN